MYLQADRDLVARDPALPGLRLLLDPEAFGDALSRALPGQPIGAVAFHYVRYKPGTNSLSAFTVDVAGTPVRGYAKAYHADDWAKLTKAEERPTVPSPLGPGRLVLGDAAIEVITFPNDNKLRRLTRLFDESSQLALFGNLFPDQLELQLGDIQLLRYKPERRFVGRLDVDGEPRAAIKLYSQRAYTAARTAAETLSAAGSLLGHSDKYGILAFAWQPGAPLIDSIDGPRQSLSTIAQVGSTLAAFHEYPADGLSVRDRAAEVATVQATAASIGHLYPSLARLVGDLAGRLSAELHDAPPIVQPIHGDFYDRQVLVNGDEVVILDLDEAILGDPAADLGLFVAHLERDALSRGLAAASVAPVRDALLAGYGLPPARIDLYTAFGLLQLAPHHFRNREPDWPERTEATLERALEIAGRSVVSIV
jgi:hypothetical protein